VLVAGAVLTLGGAAPRTQFEAVFQLIRSPRTAVDHQGIDHAVAACAGSAAWLFLGWLGCGVALVVASALPGTLGRAAGRVSAWVVPGVMRRLLSAALGIGLAAAGTGGLATPAHAAPTGPAPAPQASAGATTPPISAAVTLDLDWPLTASRAARVVTVRRGDTLWAIAAAHLAPHAGPRAIATAWPRWWSANRHVVGPDPDLLHPGQRLTAPGTATT
jgi:hypothetical protein